MDIDEIRRINLKELEKIHGPDLAKRAEMSPTQFYNLRDGAKDSKTGKPRGMRKETAWKLEKAAGVQKGYLDILHSGDSSIRTDQISLSTLESEALTVFRQLPSESERRYFIESMRLKVNESSTGRSNPLALKKA